MNILINSCGQTYCVSVQETFLKKKWGIMTPKQIKREAESQKDARENNINHKIRLKVRSRMTGALTKQNACRAFHFDNLLGCSIDDLKIWLEKRFLPGMSWENYNNGSWHIDHIRPCASFNLTSKYQQKKCFHYTNLQPLWAIDNLKKSDKILKTKYNLV